MPFFWSLPKVLIISVSFILGTFYSRYISGTILNSRHLHLSPYDGIFMWITEHITQLQSRCEQIKVRWRSLLRTVSIAICWSITQHIPNKSHLLSANGGGLVVEHWTVLQEVRGFNSWILEPAVANRCCHKHACPVARIQLCQLQNLHLPLF